jgi:histidyl-tRNA synthetase
VRSSKIERPRGTRDFLPEEMEKRRGIERIMREIAESFGYREISTPVFEHLELFTLKSGESIVEEMYTFKDKSGRWLALRPELTAPAMRLFVNECSVMPKPLRFYYFANCFRYERPQKGRYREFWQFGVELIGSNSFLADAEVIFLSNTILEHLNLQFDLEIGHVGIMRELLAELENQESSRIMRLIDKNDIEGLELYMDEVGLDDELKEKIRSLIELKGGREIINEAQEIVDFDFTHLENLADILDFLNVDYRFNLGIARGLDYYTGVVFECYAEGLGAQKQICGGGSYELASLFGGEPTPSTGFAIGFDRVCEICEVDKKMRIVAVVISFSGLEKYAFKVAKTLRDQGIEVVVDVMERSVKRQFSYANDINADYAIIVGESEIKSGKVSVKDLKSGEQRQMRIEEVVSYIKK